ncbi:hypothetical protein O6P43_017259 [Quillaja saponaria]|uniref:Uncharacterized protein n=1 Tax=Quillaja saponaria TaxID=32244 RepID=A0AAD7LPJ9_QUISA|nr:hypothetical protein O6P43_017259 [Quillaja saponaria]
MLTTLHVVNKQFPASEPQRKMIMLFHMFSLRSKDMVDLSDSKKISINKKNIDNDESQNGDARHHKSLLQLKQASSPPTLSSTLVTLAYTALASTVPYQLRDDAYGFWSLMFICCNFLVLVSGASVMLLVKTRFTRIQILVLIISTFAMGLRSEGVEAIIHLFNASFLFFIHMECRLQSQNHLKDGLCLLSFLFFFFFYLNPF